MVVSWAMPTSPNAELANAMLNAAAATLSEGAHPVGHTDRGCHTAGLVESRGARDTASRGRCRRGVLPGQQRLRRFFGRLKVELLGGRSLSGWSVDDFMGTVDCYIHWHNERRIKESLGGMSPLQYGRSLNLAA